MDIKDTSILGQMADACYADFSDITKADGSYDEKRLKKLSRLGTSRPLR
jgi:hypothetical protein